MAKLKGFSLRAQDVDTTQKEGGGALPDGFYRFEVDEITEKPHFDNRPGYKLDFVLEVIEPAEYKGRKIFVDFGVVDPENEEFEGWARDALGRLLVAIDFPKDQVFDDPDEIIGKSGIAKYGLDRKRSDKQNKRFGKLWAYVYPDDERDWLENNEIGPSERQEEWFPAKQTPAADRGSRGGRDDRGSRGGDRGGSRGRDEGRGRDDRGSRDSERGRGRDRDEERGRDRSERRDERGTEDDDIPFDGNPGSGDGGDDRPKRGGGANPWNRGRR